MLRLNLSLCPPPPLGHFDMIAPDMLADPGRRAQTLTLVGELFRLLQEGRDMEVDARVRALCIDDAHDLTIAALLVASAMADTAQGGEDARRFAETVEVESRFELPEGDSHD